MKKNLFIAFEGIDGSGKSTQALLLAEKLRKEGHRVYTTFEPTSRPIGAMIRTILKGGTKTDERVIAGLFVADRLDHLLNTEDGIVQKLAEGYTVICDRYCFSSYAYQGTHMDMDWVINANAMSASILRPDINLFIDVAPQTCIDRINANRESVELYETLDNLTLVRDNFFLAFEKLQQVEKIALINGNRSMDEISEDIFENLMTFWPT